MPEQTDSQRPSSLPTHNAERQPRAFRSRMRRKLRDARPRLWNVLTGNTRVRYGKPWQMALFITGVVVAILVTSYMVLIGDTPR